MAEKPDERYPFILLTGRGSSSQWHTETRTKKSALLRKLSPESVYVEIHPDDAASLDILAGHPVCVDSRRGSIVARAFLTSSVQRGQVFMPMHYVETNRLTQASFDPYSKQPSYKFSAVAIRKAHGWEMPGVGHG